MTNFKILFYHPIFQDRAERHDIRPRLWLSFFPVRFPPKIRGKKKRRMNSKNRDQKSCLSARSHKMFGNLVYHETVYLLS